MDTLHGRRQWIFQFRGSFVQNYTTKEPRDVEDLGRP
jgi:hypothetical protein